MKIIKFGTFKIYTGHLIRENVQVLAKIVGVGP